MTTNRIEKSRSGSTPMRRVPSLCVLLAVACILADVPLVVSREDQQRKLRGKVTTPAAIATASETVTSNKSHSRRLKKSEHHKKEHLEETNNSQLEVMTATSASEASNGFAKMTRIVGGANVQMPQRYPWFTRVLGDTPGQGFDACGGALIAPDLVLTAAHCT